MTTTQSAAAHMRRRLFDDLDGLNAMERAVLEAKSGRETAHAALQLAQASFDLAAANEQDLLERSASLRAGALRLRISLQTMATFPSEVLAMICAEAASVQWKEHDNASPSIDWDAARAPYRFAMVNRHWRHATLSAPRCWTYVALPLIVALETETIGSIQQAELALQRSRSLLIDVNVDIQWFEVANCPTPCLVTEVDGIFKLVMANSHRIRSLGIRTGPTSSMVIDTPHRYIRKLLPMIIALATCPTPELVHLEISCGYADHLDEAIAWGSFPDDYPFLLPDAPKLESLIVSSAPILCARPHPTGLPALRTLVLESRVPIYDALLWDTIAMAPQLDVLVVACETGAESARHPLQLPDNLPLTRLKLHVDSGFPSNVACPRLHTFEFASWLLETYTISESLGRTVTTLRLDDVRFTDDELDAMRSLRAVEHACVSGTSWAVDDAPLYTSLCDTVDPMWPRLRHLEVEWVQSTLNPAERNGLLSLVRARNVSHGSESGPPPLEKLEIDGLSAPGWVAAEVKKVMGDKFVIRVRA